MEASTGNKVHIGKGGVVRPCNAVVRPCPYGGAEAHWDNPEEARIVADDINRQLANLDGFEIAVNGGYATPNKFTERAILRLANLDAKIKRMDSYKNKARNTIMVELKNKGVKTIDTGDIRATFTEGGNVRKGIDSEMFYADENLNQEDYLKEVNVSSHSSFENESAKTTKWSKKNIEDLPDFKFEVTDVDGKVGVSDDVHKGLQDLRDFEKSLKEAKQLQKEIQTSIKDKMDEKDVKELRVGKIKITSVDEHTRQQVDTKALRADGLYDNYVKESITSDRVRLTFR